MAGAVVAAGLVGVSIKKAARPRRPRDPLAGLVAAYIFALQMLNFPVASGTSGHLLGGCLAAVLVGPWVGSLCMAVVFLVQALVFADGGLTALGLNIIVMGYVTCFVGYGIYLLLRRRAVHQGRHDRFRRGRGMVRRRRLGAGLRPVLRRRRHDWTCPWRRWPAPWSACTRWSASGRRCSRG